ncbi:hypothetical protein OROHE_005416 [Orobanche hederae]
MHFSYSPLSYYLCQQNVWWLDIGRLSTGFGIGLLSYVPVYIAEITPKNIRGAFTAANQLMICCGASVMYLVGNVISWRLLALIGVIPCLIQLLGLFVIPESPRWMAKIGRWDWSEASLVRLRGKNSNISAEAAEIRDYTRALEQLNDPRIIDLFQRKYAHSLIVGLGLMALQQFGGVNAIAYYASAIFSSAGFSYRVGTTVMVIVQVPVTVLGTLLMDKSGRRPLLLVSVAGTCLGCFLIGLSFLLQDHKLSDFSPSLAFGGVLIFPVNVKGLAGSLVTVVNWFGSWIITYSFNFLAQWSSAGTFFIFATFYDSTGGAELNANNISYGSRPPGYYLKFIMNAGSNLSSPPENTVGSIGWEHKVPWMSVVQIWHGHGVRAGHKLNLASKFTAKAILGRVQLARYMRAPIALSFIFGRPKVISITTTTITKVAATASATSTSKLTMTTTSLISSCGICFRNRHHLCRTGLVILYQEIIILFSK